MTGNNKEQFPYSEEFKTLIRELSGDRPGPDNAPDWLTLSMKRVADKRRNFLPILNRYTQLDGAMVLEVGCGTGPASVVMAEQGAKVTALDIDPRIVEAARLRVRDHGFSEAVDVSRMTETGLLDFASGSFDLVVCNGVLEHVRPYLRTELCREMWRVLRQGGHLFIGETPNRLWPKDVHTTGLWFQHYLPAKWAERYAKWRHRIGPDERLSELGGLGCFYGSIIRSLPRQGRKVLNLDQQYSWIARHKKQARALSPIKRLIETPILFGLDIFERLLLRPFFRMPFDGLLPYLTIDVVKK